MEWSGRAVRRISELSGRPLQEIPQPQAAGFPPQGLAWNSVQVRIQPLDGGPQAFRQAPAVGAEGQDEMPLLLELLVLPLDGKLEPLVAHVDLPLARKRTDPRSQPKRVAQVHREDSVEEAHDQAEGKVIREPVEPGQDPGMDEEVVDRAQHPPEEAEQGADDALDVPPVGAVVPQLYVHSLDEDEPANVLHRRDAQGHDDEEDKLLHQRAPGHETHVNEGEREEQAQAQPVEGQVGSVQEARVHPAVLGIVAAEELAPEQLDAPADEAPSKEQECQYQKQRHGSPRT